MKSNMLQEKFKDKYRISSARHTGWVYSSAGAYFVTICTKNRENYFGEIVSESECMDKYNVETPINVETPCMASLRNVAFNRRMKLTEIGQVALDEWLRTPDIRPDMHILLDEFCIMPNHFHGIIIFYGAGTLQNDNRLNYGRDANQCRDAMHGVSTEKNRFGPQSKNLGSVIRGFKSAVRSYAVKHKIDFAWQSGYYDRIIRDAAEHNRIQQYVLENPDKWENDEYY